MSVNLSLAEILDSLEKRIVYLREQLAIHTRQEEHHREQRAALGAELETAVQRVEALKTVAVPAAELLQIAAASAAPVQEGGPNTGPDSRVAGLITRILASRPDNEPFSPKDITAEINRRFQDRLAKAADVRNVSSVLRRMHRNRHIHLVREGRAYHEALYAKGPRPRQ